jgi:hypothetical protein
MLSRRAEVLLSYFTGLAPVGEAFCIAGATIAADLRWPQDRVKGAVVQLRRRRRIRLANTAELGGGRGYVVLWRLEEARPRLGDDRPFAVPSSASLYSSAPLRKISKGKEIVRLLECFRQTQGNTQLLLDTFVQHVAPFSDEAVTRAVRQFLSGDVHGQNLRFAPSVPEFIAEARRCQQILDIAARPTLPAPPYPPASLTPLAVARKRGADGREGCPVLFENVDYDRFRRLRRDKLLPSGAFWVVLGTVYGRRPAAQAGAA